MAEEAKTFAESGEKMPGPPTEPSESIMFPMVKELYEELPEIKKVADDARDAADEARGMRMTPEMQRTMKADCG
jgi:hypothetical protein